MILQGVTMNTYSKISLTLLFVPVSISYSAHVAGKTAWIRPAPTSLATKTTSTISSSTAITTPTTALPNSNVEAKKESTAPAAVAVVPVCTLPSSLGDDYPEYSLPKDLLSVAYQSGGLRGDNPGKFADLFSHVVGLITSGKFSSALTVEPNIADHIRRAYVAANTALANQTTKDENSFLQLLTTQRAENVALVTKLGALIAGCNSNTVAKKMSDETFSDIQKQLQISKESNEKILEEAKKHSAQYTKAIDSLAKKLIEIQNSRSIQSAQQAQTK